MNQVINLVKATTAKQSELLKKAFAVFAVLALTVQLVLPAANVMAQAVSDESQDAEQILEHNASIDLCHATGSQANPYNKLTVNVNALSGHDDHDDEVWYSGIT